MYSVVYVYLTASYVNVCYRDDPKVADCLKKEIERLIPKLQSGEPMF